MSLSLSPYLDPPPRRTYPQDHPTLLVTYWITSVCLVIILFRVAGRYVRIVRLYSDDKLMMLTIVPLCIRLAFVHAVLLYGTNNVAVDGISPREVHQREIGSGLVLGARISHLAFIWSQKLTISEFYVRLTAHLYERRYRIGLTLIRYSLYISFFAVAVSIFFSCHPPTQLTRVLPPPHSAECRVAFAPLYTQCVFSVLTDLALVLAPLPAIFRSSLPALKKARLVFSFSLATACVGITTYRAYSTTLTHGSQQHRTLWASLEVLTATIVGNGIVIHTFARDRGEKKLKFHHLLHAPDVTGVRSTDTKVKASEEDPAGLYASTAKWTAPKNEEATAQQRATVVEKPKKALLMRDVGGLLEDFDPPGMREEGEVVELRDVGELFIGEDGKSFKSDGVGKRISGQTV